MKTVGFPISQKENERRRCLIPSDIKNIKHKEYVFVEKGYGNCLGYTDDEYIREGVKVVSQDEVLKKDIICDAKIGDALYLSKLNNQVVFGYIHAVQNKEITDVLIKNKLSVYAWEDMFEDGRHVFWRNNEIAGEAAIIHAYTILGTLPHGTRVALLGKGNIARGALKILSLLGANVTVYDKKTEKLLQKELNLYDVVVNCILWDTSRTDHIIYKEDLKKMKKGSLIIDISCDRNGGIETSIPTSISEPTYVVDNIVHYAVDHTPAVFYKTTSICLSLIISHSINMLIEDTPNDVLKNALIIKCGEILDQRIFQFQKR